MRPHVPFMELSHTGGQRADAPLTGASAPTGETYLSLTQVPKADLPPHRSVPTRDTVLEVKPSESPGTTLLDSYLEVVQYHL